MIWLWIYLAVTYLLGLWMSKYAVIDSDGTAIGGEERAFIAGLVWLLSPITVPISFVGMFICRKIKD